MTYDDVQIVLEYLQRKGFLAGSLTAEIIMPVLKRDDDEADILSKRITL